MVTKKVRTEYMKKFRDPKWETFSKCYEDSLRYRLTRRVMEHSHKPWFWEGWDGASLLSSGRSTPKSASWHGRANRVAPVPAADETERSGSGSDAPEEVTAPDVDAAPPAEVAVIENAISATANNVAEPDAADGPPDSNGNPAQPTQSRREGQNASPADLKSQRAKSQPPPGSAEAWRRRNGKTATPDNVSPRRGQSESKTTINPDGSFQNERCDACVQTTSTNLRRRARSADPGEARRQRRWTAATGAAVGAAVVVPTATGDERWVTEYMRCFSARLR
ncbi:uncharacterized protein ccsapa [Stigmatopora argus]